MCIRDRVNDEYFINVLAGGLLTDIAYKVPKDKKAVLGKIDVYKRQNLVSPASLVSSYSSP